ncbi:MAG: hypothetical protein E7Z87_04670 [Cyanobacteria bacterium SIG26]|nr:hypothetical protein [Cyanobacteria bacterium SIG26]
MKKLYMTLVALVAMLFSFAPQVNAATVEILPTMNSKSVAQNQIWVGTFQIVWNEFMDNFIKKPIKFDNYNSIVAKNLNKKDFKKTDINEESYYTTFGIVSPELRVRIEQAIKEKFNETSDILDQFSWKFDPQKIFVYAMLKKDFKFLTPFDKLASGGFADNSANIDYFGIDDNSEAILNKNVEVLFYNNDNDFAVKLYTKGDDEVLLYRTSSNKTFDKIFKQVVNKSKKYKGDKVFGLHDELRVPDINIYLETSFKDVEGHYIKGTDFIIEKTIETVDFKMNNEGVKLKSEAALSVKCMSLAPQIGRNFYFTDDFVLFLIEKDKKVPYYAMKVSDVESLNKTGR